MKPEYVPHEYLDDPLTKRQKCVSYGSYLRKCSMADNTTKKFDFLTFMRINYPKRSCQLQILEHVFFGKVSAIQANHQNHVNLRMMLSLQW